MKKYYYSLMFMALLALGYGCKKDSDFLNRTPKDILTDDQVWKSPTLIVSVLANLYDRLPDDASIDGDWRGNGCYDEAFISDNGDYWRVDNSSYSFDWWNTWDYGFVRELNVFVQQAGKATTLDSSVRKRFYAEGRFLRAMIYFNMVKRMGGVPLITEPMSYDFSGDASYLQQGRAKESEIYDFIINEMEAAKVDLPDDAGEKSRATKAAALALEAKAALYAGSIAQYGVTTPLVTLTGDIVGVPASKASGYYTIALRAAKEIISTNKYALYRKKPDLSENFASLFLDKNDNAEVILAKDFKLKSKVHTYTIDCQPMSSSEMGTGNKFNPTLNFVQEFEMLDNTFAPMANLDASGKFIKYINQQGIFAGRDARLAGTVLLPGSSFKGKSVDVCGGLLKASDGTIRTDTLVGIDGPIGDQRWRAQTGFLIRKYLDPNAGSGTDGVRSDVWWIRFRYAEVLLNAAEAAFQLGDNATAAEYLNQVRARAGFTTPLQAGAISFDRIVHERKVELAFEDQRLWDLKRWRLANKVWNGVDMDETTLKQNIGKADKFSTQAFGLILYKYSNPGQSDDGQWVFKVQKPLPVRGRFTFNMGNYYSKIGDGTLSKNPKLVKQPNQ